MKTPDQDRRQNSRFDTLNLVQVEVYSANYEDSIESGIGRILNASKSGFLLETNFKIELGSIVHLQIILNSEVVLFKTSAVRCFISSDSFYCTGLVSNTKNIPAIAVLTAYLQSRFHGFFETDIRRNDELRRQEEASASDEDTKS